MFHDLQQIIRGALKVFFAKGQRKTSYSQFGEDMVLGQLIGKDVKNGSYLDVGCYHPIKHSNTYFLYKRGWKGVLIDVELAKLVTCRLVRPRDKTLLCGISDQVGKMPIFAAKPYSVMTSLSPISDDHRKIGVVDVTTITEVIEKYFAGDCPTLISVDIEGHDIEAIRGIDFAKYRPQYLIVECHESSLGIEAVLQSDLYKLISEKGYDLRGWTGPSLIFTAL